MGEVPLYAMWKNRRLKFDPRSLPLCIDKKVRLFMNEVSLYSDRLRVLIFCQPRRNRTAPFFEYFLQYSQIKKVEGTLKSEAACIWEHPVMTIQRFKNSSSGCTCTYEA